MAECNRAQDGDWRFVLQTTDGRRQLEVADAEPELAGERLELLTVVRGLESLDQPSRVTLVTPSAYVTRGLAYGLEEWRANDFHWERHGEMVPVKNRDLWRRVDRALKFHAVDCRVWRIDKAHAAASPALLPAATGIAAVGDEPQLSKTTIRRRSRHGWRRTILACRRALGDAFSSARLRFAACGTGLLPHAWME